MKSPEMNNARILVVEDEAIITAVIETNLTSQGFRVSAAADGQAAWELIEQSALEFDAILLDRAMPRMDGLTLLRKLRARPEGLQIPVIMATSFDDKASILEGLNAGAYYYLTKPLQIELLLVVVRAAVQQYSEQRQLRQCVRQTEEALGFLAAATFHYRRLAEVTPLAALLARLCPQPDQAVLGLHELMVNAIEHGNLGLTYADKSRLLLSGGLREELERRQQLAENRDKRAEIQFERTPQAIYFTLQDQGDGFAAERYLHFDPERAFDPHGRGIAVARLTSFDALEYLGNGNAVRMRIALTQA